MVTDREPPSDLHRPPSAAFPAAGASILDELMTARQIAGVLQMRVSTVEEYARRGLLPSVKLGRHRRFVRSQVDQAIIALSEPFSVVASRSSQSTGRRHHRPLLD